VTSPPDLSTLSHAEKDTLILALFAQLAAAHERIAAQEREIVCVWRTVQPMTKLGRWVGERERRFAAKEWTGHRQRPSTERCQQSTYDNMRSARFSPKGAVEAGAACV
jgi:hypothetical protein